MGLHLNQDYVEKSNTLNIRIGNIQMTLMKCIKVKIFARLYNEKYKEFLLKENDLIIAMTDMAGDPKILGLPTLVKNLNIRKFLLNQRVGKLHKFSKEICTLFMLF